MLYIYKVKKIDSFKKPGLSTEHNDTDGDEILVSKTFFHHPSCINF
jgi:hypothetical protein